MNFSLGTTMRLPTRSTGKPGWCISSYPLDSDTPTVVVSTANPYKFPQSVYRSVAHAEEEDAEKAIKKLNAFSAAEIPAAISGLKDKKILHDKTVEVADIEQTVLDIIGSKQC